MSLAILVHALASTIWVGGMFFAYLCLRPSCGALVPSVRLGLWRRVFQRFFVWVWLAVVTLLGSGLYMIFAVFGGMGAVGWHVHLMLAFGLAMMALFAHLFFAPWKRFSSAFDQGRIDEAATQLNAIRRIVLVNLLLGLANVVLGAAGRFFI